MLVTLTKSSQKVASVENNTFYCKFCNYSTSKFYNYNKHLQTIKHQRITMDNKKEGSNFICECGKYYKYNSGLSKHKKNCNYNQPVCQETKKSGFSEELIFKLLEKINKFAPIKHILKNQSNDDQKIIELLEDISRDLMNYDLEFRIQELESKFSIDMSEATFNELKELKKKQNLN